MRYIALAPIALAITVLPTPASAEQQSATHWERNGCSQPVTRAQYRHQVRRVYRYSNAGGDFIARPVKRGRAKLQRRRSCAYTERAHRQMSRFTHQRTAAWRWHREIDRITVYGKWSIPPAIVMCESGGSWSAYNPSGASGPYQLLGWGAPMPANTPERQAAHHRIAARLWSGGGGRSHWVC